MNNALSVRTIARLVAASFVLIVSQDSETTATPPPPPPPPPSNPRFNATEHLSVAISDCRQVVLGMRVYAADHGGKYATKVMDLVAAGVFDAQVIAKISKVRLPNGKTGGDWIVFQDLCDSSPGWCVFIASPKVKIAFGSEWRIVALNDASVSAMQEEEFQKLLTEQGKSRPDMTPTHPNGK